jgi:hypothetical protein
MCQEFGGEDSIWNFCCETSFKQSNWQIQKSKRGEAVTIKVAGSYTKDLGCVKTPGFVTTAFEGYKIRKNCLHICNGKK